MSECLTIHFTLPEGDKDKSRRPGRQLFAEMIQEAGSGSEIGEAVLPFVHRIHRPDGGLMTAPGMSAFRVFEGKGQFSIRAIGDQASQYLGRNIHHVAGWLSRKAGTIVPMSWEGGIVGLAPTKKMNEYFINGLILARPIPKASRWKKKRERYQEIFETCVNHRVEDIDRQMVEKKVRRGIEAQSDLIGADMPEDGLLIEVLDIPATKLIEGKDGQMWPAVNVRFATNVRLRGPWNVGPGASKGFGLVVTSRQQQEQKAA